MIIFSAIGNFFKKIWNWIKETAWVQPLLIVGLIFGVIFSIPSIVKGINELNEELKSSETYFTKFQLSLSNGDDSAFVKFAEMANENTEKAIQEQEINKKYGEKFFVAFVEKNSSGCTDLKEGLEVLENNFTKTSFKPNDGKPFKLYSVFMDEVTGNEVDDETQFKTLTEDNETVSKFNENAAGYYETEFLTKGYYFDKYSESDIEKLAWGTFSAPTLMLFDYTNGFTGFSEVIFSVKGTTENSKAQFLLDCWNHANEFERK